MKCPKCHSDNTDTARFCSNCATPLPPSEEISTPDTETLEAAKEELTTGSTFAGRYQIIEELGRGGMGKVYKALDKEIKGKVALKLIKPEIAADKKTIERFRNELKMTRDIAHKNVCRMYDLNKEEGTYYITMEYVSGEDLKSFIRRAGPLSAGKTIFIAKQVCEGLTEAHRLGVVHRDLKSQNIMIDREGNARIMDFGIARSLKEKGITGSGVMIGTPEYMSPEQAEAKGVDKRSDIYSLGVILYEMVTGRVPFEGETPLSIAMKHKGEIPKDPREINAQIPEDLSRVILRCVEKDKDKRYQGAEEVLSELENIEKGIPTTEKVVPKRKPTTAREITVTFRLKKFLIPALVVVVLVIAAVAIWQLLPTKDIVPARPSKHSIAVLPFEDLSPQKDQAFFCDGLADELINRLTNIENLKVPARASAFSFKGKELNIQEIGKKLNVDLVLVGSLRKAGKKLRITTELVKVLDGYPLWSEKYERDEEDIFALQDEISLAIVDTLKIKLLGEEKEKLVKRDTENLEAFRLYLQGRWLWDKRTEAHLRRAIEYFEKALEEDPNYARAYAGLADTYTVLPFYSSVVPKEAYIKAREAVLKSLEIDNMLAEAHSSLAAIKEQIDFDWEGAYREHKRAVELNPGYASAHHWYALHLIFTGKHDDAIAEIKLAQELDPLSLIININVGAIFYYSRLYDKAIAQLRFALELFPNAAPAHDQLGMAYLAKGKYEEGIAELQEAVNLERGFLDYKTKLGYAYAVSGKRDKAMEIIDELKELSKQKYVSPYFMAATYGRLDEKDQAFQWLEKAYEERDVNVIYLKVDPVFEPLRSDSRFKALLKKLNLE